MKKKDGPRNKGIAYAKATSHQIAVAKAMVHFAMEPDFIENHFNEEARRTRRNAVKTKKKGSLRENEEGSLIL